MLLDIDWNQIGAGVIIAGSLVALIIALWRVGPAGAQTVATIRELADSRAEKIMVLEAAIVEQSETIGSKDDAIHQTEKEVLEREKTIAALEARPDTLQMLDNFEHHTESLITINRDNFAQTQLVLERMLENQSSMMEGLTQANEALGEIITQSKTNDPST
jgi:hypothetical protein